MKKILYFLPVAVLALASCSSDEPTLQETPGVDESQKVFDGDAALMSINIMNAESTRSRAVSENPADFVYGSTDESNVNSLSFYFYDKVGDYVTKYANASITPVSSTDPFVEVIGQSKIVLTDLLGQNYPAYVVAIINAPTSFDLTGKTLSQAYAATLDKAASWSVNNGKAENFIMTSATSSENGSDFHYFATPVKEENFAVQTGSQGDPWPSDIDATPVDIYVERLAAKIQLDFASNFELLADGSYRVKLDGQYHVDGVDTDLYAQLLGWGVNGVAKNTFYFKHINDTNPFETTDGWNFDGTHRCYWAQTPGYGTTEYPNSFEDVTQKGGNGEYSDVTAPRERLTYISYNDVLKNKFTANNFAYIPANTERGENIWVSATNSLLHAALTEVLIAAKIVDTDGNTIPLYQLSDTYYTRTGVINYLLNAAGNHIWKKEESAEGTKYVNIAKEDLDVVYGYDGTFKLKVTNDVRYYKDNIGSETWSSSTAVANHINSFLPERQSFCFNDGMMYYNIPVRHLRSLAKGEQVKTGHYGIVRNHWYKLNVNSVANLGHSVYRPGEHIIPNTDDTRYMIGASIKPLPWRIVNQDVEL